MTSFVRQTCPSCGKEGRVRDENLGLKVRCKRCGVTIVLTADTARPARSAPLGVAGEVVQTADMVRALRLAEQRERLWRTRLAELGEQLERARRDNDALADRVERLTLERDDARVEAALSRGEQSRIRPGDAERLRVVRETVS